MLTVYSMVWHQTYGEFATTHNKPASVHPWLSRHLEKEVVREWNEIEKRREQFSARAVIQELNALVEEVLHSIAQPVSSREQGKNSNHGIPKPVWEYPIGTVWELIEQYYAIDRSDIRGWDVYVRLRDMANAFKHRQGFRRFRDTVEKGVIDINDVQSRATFESAKQFLDTIKPFLMSVSALKPRAVGAQQLT